MKHYGIDNQYILAAESSDTLPSWDTKYKRSFIYAEDTGIMSYGTATGWKPWGTSGTSGSSGTSSTSGSSGSSGLSGDRYTTTSSTELTLSIGTKTLTIGTGLQYAVGQMVNVVYDTTHMMQGTCTSYNSGNGSLVISVALFAVTGSGTYSSWTVSLSGAAGPSGSSGTSGSSGIDGTSGSSGTSGTGTSGSSGSSGTNSVALSHVSISTTTNLGTSDTVVLCDATSAGFIVNLQEPSVMTDKMIYIKKTDSSVNVVTVTTPSGKIDQSTTYLLELLDEFVLIISDGTNYRVMAE